MFEKRWKAVPPQLFTADGTVLGKITVADSCLFKVKQLIVLTSPALATPSHDILEVKRITDGTTLYVGLRTANIDSRYDASAYLAADGAAIHAIEQLRSKVPEQEIERHTYEEEPVVARRTVLVDPCDGEKVSVIEDANGKRRLAVDAALNLDGATINAEINVENPVGIKVTNVTVGTAGTELTHVLMPNSSRFAIKVRDGAASLKVGLVSGNTLVGPYFKVNRGVVFDSGDMDLVAPYSIYFNADVAGTTIEILNWYF